tara:strand:+ start:17760 stop:19700 length:1941 start_codon:yes stop_codon:yes gene_type:complete
MAAVSPKHTQVEHLFRPVFEIKIAWAWIACAVITPFMNDIETSNGVPVWYYIVGVMIVVALGYFATAMPYIKRQMLLTINRKTFLTTSTLRKMNKLRKRQLNKGKDKREVSIGKGFDWGAEHAQRAYQVLDMSSGLSEVQIPFSLKLIVKALSHETKKLGGSPWIHGMGDEQNKYIVEDTLYGHTFIAGNVGTGKTTLLRLLSINALHLGNVLVILDPKNDKDWQNTIKMEMEYLGKGDQFYHIHPSKPSESARIALLKNFTREVEVANRVAPLMGGAGGNSKPFQDFAYEIIYLTVLALKYLGRPVRLTSIQRVISSGRRTLAKEVFLKFFKTINLDGAESEIAQEIRQNKGIDELVVMYNLYVDKYKKHHECTAVDGMAQFALHEQGHYDRMVVTLKPVLTALTASPLDEILSPIDDPNKFDSRPLVNLHEVVEKGGCIYISLDSLTDGQSAGFISRLILSELAAVAGERYNRDDQYSRRVTIANDEVHASLENNDALLNILAQGRAASIQMILATQTVSDIESKTDEATSRRFLGLCNNFISMRTTDPKTQEYVTQQFSKTSISQVQAQSGSGNTSSESMLSFSASYGERVMNTREDAFPMELLGQLPILQYVARLADGRRLKMRLPVLINNDKPGARAPWIQ